MNDEQIYRNLIQTDTPINPGNSGGPVLDQKGRLVGVVVSGLRGTGVNFVIPVNRVREFFAENWVAMSMMAFRVRLRSSQAA